MTDFEKLETEVEMAKEAYMASNNEDWLGYVVSLKALSEAYKSDNQIGKSLRCDREVQNVLEGKNMYMESMFTQLSEVDISSENFAKISEWAERVAECKKALSDGYPVTEYAKGVIALGEYLLLAQMPDVALVVFDEALGIILPASENNPDDTNIDYYAVVVMLRAAHCAMISKHKLLFKNYSLASLYYLANRLSGREPYNFQEWPYVTQLCKELIDKI